MFLTQAWLLFLSPYYCVFACVCVCYFRANHFMTFFVVSLLRFRPLHRKRMAFKNYCIKRARIFLWSWSMMQTRFHNNFYRFSQCPISSEHKNKWKKITFFFVCSPATHTHTHNHMIYILASIIQWLFWCMVRGLFIYFFFCLVVRRRVLCAFSFVCLHRLCVYGKSARMLVHYSYPMYARSNSFKATHCCCCCCSMHLFFFFSSWFSSAWVSFFNWLIPNR